MSKFIICMHKFYIYLMNHDCICSRETEGVSQTKDQETSSPNDDVEVRCLTAFLKGSIIIFRSNNLNDKKGLCNDIL